MEVREPTGEITYIHITSRYLLKREGNYAPKEFIINKERLLNVNVWEE